MEEKNKEKKTQGGKMTETFLLPYLYYREGHLCVSAVCPARGASRGNLEHLKDIFNQYGFKEKF